MQEVLGILAARAGVSNSDTQTTNLGGLANGCVFVLCGVGLDDLGVQALVQLLEIDSGQLAECPLSGEYDDLDKLEQLLTQLQRFLESERHSDEYLDQQEEFRGAMEAQAESQSAFLGALGNKSNQLAARMVANQAKIVSAQLTQCFMALKLDLQWPDFLTLIARRLGALLVFDLDLLAVSFCIQDGMLAGTIVFAFMFVAIVIMMVVYINNQWRKGKCGKDTDGNWKSNTWTASESEENGQAAARAAHMSNTGWAAFTMLSPLAFSQCLFLALDDGTSVFKSVPVILLVGVIPGFAILKLLEARLEARLRSRAFEAMATATTQVDNKTIQRLIVSTIIM